jgi:hypothetical protein
MPGYIAVSKDRQQHVILSKSEVKECRKKPTVCPIKRAANRKQAATSCVVAMLLGDEEAEQAHCNQILIPWTGAYSYYLGSRKWIYSGKDDITVTITCESGEKTSTMGIPSFGVIDVPSGCSAHTDDWVLPASFHSEYQFQLDPINFNFTFLSLNPPPIGSPIPSSPYSKRKQVMENLTETINEMLALKNRDRPLEGLKIQYLQALAEKIRSEKQWIGQFQCPFEFLILSLIVCMSVILLVVWVLCFKRALYKQFAALQTEFLTLAPLVKENADTEEDEHCEESSQPGCPTPFPTPKPALRKQL